jgi:hypothetical protein
MTGGGQVTEPQGGTWNAGGFVVLREVSPGHWEVVGDVDRRPGLTARASRVQAVQDATGGAVSGDEHYAAVPRSEWRVARQL